MTMQYISPRKFSKSKTNSSGNTLRDNSKSETDINTLKVLSSWRAAHSHPMDVFKQRLKRTSVKIDEKVNEKDYISNPKKDGYRSIHVIYKYNSDKGKREKTSLKNPKQT